jgi:hypothetical protein
MEVRKEKREKRVQNPDMKYHCFELHQKPGTEAIGQG